MGLLLSEFWERHYLPVRLLGRAAGTVADYRSFLHRWDETMGPVPVEEIDLPTACNFMRAMLATHSAATVNKFRAYLLAILREARSHHLCRPKWLRRLKRLPEEKRLPVAWTREQVEAILRSAAQEPGSICGIPACMFWLAAFLIFFNTGLRKSACLSIKTADVDLSRGLLIVRAGSQKQRAEQWFAINERTSQAITAIYEPIRVWLLPWPGCPKTFERHFAAVCRRAGVPVGGHSGIVHRGRTTAITAAWQINPAHAQQLAGHASIETTFTHYVDPRAFDSAADKRISLF